MCMETNAGQYVSAYLLRLCNLYMCIFFFLGCIPKESNIGESLKP